MEDAQKLALAAAYVGASRARDIDTLVALSEPDLRVWHNDGAGDVDLGRMVETLRWLHRVAPDVEWDDVEVLATSAGFVWRAVLHGTGPGGPFRADTCMVAAVSPAGRVASLAEYLDPAALASLSG